MTDDYVAFYPPKGFWAINAPDLNRLPKDSNDFETLMEEEVFVHTSRDYTLKVCRDGLVLVKINNLERNRSQFQSEGEGGIENQIIFTSQYYAHLNAILLLIETAVAKHRNLHLGNTSLRTGDAFRIKFEEGKMKGASATPSQNILVRFLSTYQPSLPLFTDLRLFSRSITVPDTVFKTVVNDFDKVVGDFAKIKILNQIMVSFGQFELLDFTASIVQAWFVIEYFLNIFWLDFLKDKEIGFDRGGKWRNREAFDFFMEADFTTAYNISKLLKYGDQITGSVYNKIDIVRRKRNEIAHSVGLRLRYANQLRKTPQDLENDNAILYTDCIPAFEVIHTFIKEEYDIDLLVPTGVSFAVI